MRWTKLGRVYAPDGSRAWMATHASLPVAHIGRSGQLRVLVGGRDSLGRSHPGWIELDPVDPLRVIGVAEKPILPLGRPGTFDDSGIMPSWLTPLDGSLHLYYIGWNVQATTPYRLSIGLAISRDDGLTFEKVSEGPVLDRAVDEPFFATAPCVLHEDGRWRMWYVSCTGWEELEGRLEPVYRIRHAESADGVCWERGPVCLDYDASSCVFGRPCVFVEDGRYRMIYSYRARGGYRTERSQSYRLGQAVSADGIEWERRDADVGIDREESGWDSEMMEYAHVLRHRDRQFLLYNGNGFGRSGFGLAVRTS
jgi:hypothetical protein